MRDNEKGLIIVFLILIFILSIIVNASEFVLSCILLFSGSLIAVISR